jgi:thioredoxin 1
MRFGRKQNALVRKRYGLIREADLQVLRIGLAAGNLLPTYPAMKRLLPACLCLVLAAAARADVIEFQNGTKTECHVLSLFNQRIEFADKDGSVAHASLQNIQRIHFDSQTAATIATRNHANLNGQLLDLEYGVFILANGKGVQERIPVADVTDLTISSQTTDAPSPPPLRPKPAPVSAADSRPQARGSIQPEHGKITIVDFYADWCGPCRRMGPILEKIAEENSNVVVQKVNIDKHPDLAKEYKATAIPHIIIYDKQGGEVDTVIGADEQRVRKAVDDANSG